VRETTNTPRSGGCSPWSFPDRQGRGSLPALSRGGAGYRRYASASAHGAAILQKRAGDAATYEKQNESACAAAPVLSEAPGAFLHFHPPSPFSTSPTLTHPPAPSGPSDRYHPSLRSLGAYPPRRQPRSFSPSSTLFLLVLRQARLRRIQPPSTPLAPVSVMDLCFLLRFGAFLNARTQQ